MRLNYTSSFLYSLLLLLSLTAYSAAQTASNETNFTISLDTRNLFSRQVDTSSLTDDAEFRSQMLAGHNFFRSQHAASALIWNDQRASSSATWSKRCNFEHSHTEGAGENIAAGFTNVMGTVNAWGLERKDYNFDRPGFMSGTGHFTQMVWKVTSSVGCGRTKCPGSLNWFIVCQYAPPGNVVSGNLFTVNVGKQISGSSTVGWNGKATSPGNSASDPDTSGTTGTSKSGVQTRTSTSTSEGSSKSTSSTVHTSKPASITSSSVSNIVYTSNPGTRKSGITSGGIYTSDITGKLTTAAESNTGSESTVNSKTMGSGTTKHNVSTLTVIMGLVAAAAAGLVRPLH